MFLTNILCKKVKSKHILVLLESTITKHKVPVLRERTADKIEVIRKDPYIRMDAVYKEIKKLKSM